MKPFIKILFYGFILVFGSFIVVLYSTCLLTIDELIVSGSFLLLAFITLKLAIKFDL